MSAETPKPARAEGSPAAPGRNNPFDAWESAPADWLAAWIADPAPRARARTGVAQALGPGLPLSGAGPDAGDAVRAVRSICTAAGGVAPTEPHAALPALRRAMRVWYRAFATTELVGEPLTLTPPVVIVSNHLSFIDTTATDAALAAAAPDAADALWVVSGPKVWDAPLHAVAAAALNLIPTVQSSRVSPGARPERQIVHALRAARDHVAAGHPLLLYPEGTRSRTGRLGPFLTGVRHFLGDEALRIVPIAVSGTERVYPIDADHVFPGVVTVNVGAPIPVGADPGAALVRARAAIAELLPPAFRPDPNVPDLV